MISDTSLLMTSTSLAMRMTIFSLIPFVFMTSARAASSGDLVRVKTEEGDQFVGELLEESESELHILDIALREEVVVKRKEVVLRTDGLDDEKISSLLPFHTYSAWKLASMLNLGKQRGKVVKISDSGLLVTLGSKHGLEVGNKIKLLGEAERIVDPDTGELVAILRPVSAVLTVASVLTPGLSKVLMEEAPKADPLLGQVVEFENSERRILLVPPKWKSGNQELQVGDEALFLEELILSEFTKSGMFVISREQVAKTIAQLKLEDLFNENSVDAQTLAERLMASVRISGEILVKGNFGSVFLHVTDVETSKHLGVLNGKITRDRMRFGQAQEKSVSMSKSDIKAAQPTGREIVLFPGNNFQQMQGVLFSGTRGDKNLMPTLIPDAKILQNGSRLSPTVGQMAAIRLLRDSTNFRLSMGGDFSQLGNMFWLLGWDGRNGYLLYNVQLRTNGVWYLVHIKNRQPDFSTHIRVSDVRISKPLIVSLEVDEKTLKILIEGSPPSSKIPLSKYQIGDVIFGTAPNQYGPKKFSVSKISMMQM